MRTLTITPTPDDYKYVIKVPRRLNKAIPGDISHVAYQRRSKTGKIEQIKQKGTKD